MGMRKLFLIAILFSCVGTSAQSPMYRLIRKSPSVVPLLDTYTGAEAAYSLKKVRTAYSGYAVRVRRSSDDAEQDIGFLSSGEFDTTSLKTFVGANNGFVTTWYDQSGNTRDITQATSGNQPKVVTSGVVERAGTKPTVLFTAASSNYLTGGDILDFIGLNMNVFTVAKLGSAASGSLYAKSLAGTAANRYYLAKDGGNLDSRIQDNTGNIISAAVSYSNTDLSLFETYINKSTDSTQLKKNNAQLAVVTSSISDNDMNSTYTFIVGGYNSAAGGLPPTAGLYLDGRISSIVFYLKSWNSTERTAIATEINSYYSIY